MAYTYSMHVFIPKTELFFYDHIFWKFSSMRMQCVPGPSTWEGEAMAWSAPHMNLLAKVGGCIDTVGVRQAEFSNFAVHLFGKNIRSKAHDFTIMKLSTLVET